MKIFLFAIIVCFTPFLGQAQADLKWVDAPIEINGNDTDWGQMLRFYDGDSKLKYDLRNDNEFLYLVFTTDNETVQTKLQHVGATITLKTKTKPKTTATLSLANIVPSGAITQRKPGEKPSRSEYRTQFMLNRPNLFAEGFVFTNGTITENDTNGIVYAVNWDTANVFTLEIKIALRELGGEFYSIPAMQKKSIALQVELPALERPSGGDEGGSIGTGGGMKQNQGAMGGSMGGGGMGNGGMPAGGGRMRGNGGSGASAGHYSEKMWLFELQKLKTKFKLATGNG
jgi:hypothetical protein